MTAQLDSDSVTAQIAAVTKAARAAQKSLASASRTEKDAALAAMAEAIDANRAAILEANATDLQRGRELHTAEAMLDRLQLTDERIDGLVSALGDLAALPDPIGNVLRGNNLPNGIRMQQVRVPLGVVGAIYEARPNVTVDIAGIGIKSGNAVILRGGSAAETTNGVTISVLRQALESRGAARRPHSRRRPVGTRRCELLDDLPWGSRRTHSTRGPRPDPRSRRQRCRTGY